MNICRGFEAAIGKAWMLAAGLLFAATIARAADEPRLVIDSGGHQAPERFLAFTRDGKSLVSAGDDKIVRIWDIASGKTVRTILGQIADGDQGKIFAAALSPDERYLAVGGLLGASPDSGLIRIHNFQTGEVTALLRGHTRAVHTLAFSSDGRWLASGSSDNTVKIWDAAEWKLVRTLSGHTDSAYAVAFSPDSRTLVSGSLDKTLRLWDRDSGQLLKEMTGHAGQVPSVAFSPDGRYIGSSDSVGVVKLWNGHSGKFIKSFTSQKSVVTKLSFSPNGRMLLTAGAGDFICHVFEVPSGREISRFDKHTNTVMEAAYSRDGKLVATGGGEQREIYLWNPEHADVAHKLVGSGSEIYAVGYGRDGKSVAFGTLNPDEGQNRGELEKFIVLDQEDHSASMDLSLENVAGFSRATVKSGAFELRKKPSAPDTLQLLQGGQLKHEIVTSGHRHNAFSLSTDGSVAASAGSNGFLALYSTTTGNQSASCIGHTSDVWAVAFSPDGKTLVSGSGDQTVRLWDVTLTSCRNLLTVFLGSDDEWVAWTPQGYYTSSLKGDKYIGWYVNQGLDHAAKFYPAAQFQKQFYRPDVVSEFLKSRDIDLAVKSANERRGGEVRTQAVLTSANVQQWLPPVVFINSPDSNAPATVKRLRVRGEVRSNTLPIADVKILLNGAPVQGAGDAPGGDPKRRPFDFEVELDEGPNIISVIASNEKAISEPETRKIIYRSLSPSIEQKGRLIAVAVGVSRYSNPGNSLKYADADAAAMEKVLRNQLDPQRFFSDVVVHVLKNEDATRGKIIQELNWMTKEATPKDTRILFLSGHGAVDGGSNYFFFAHEHNPDVYDLNDVSWDVILRTLKAAAGRAILFIDSCHAGAVTGNKPKDGAKRLVEIIKESNTDVSGLVTFASSEGSEDSWELDKFMHGAFTEALIEGLNERKADLDGDGVIDSLELGNWIEKRVRELTDKKQHAVYLPAPGASSFPLFRGKP
jgi:WD40 repeat protein